MTAVPAVIPSWVATAVWALFFALLSAVAFRAFVHRLRAQPETEPGPRLPSILLGFGVLAFFQALALMPHSGVQWVSPDLDAVVRVPLVEWTNVLFQTPLRAALTSASFLLAAGVMLLTPLALERRSLRSLGIGDRSLVRGLMQGALAFFIVAPGLYGLMLVCVGLLEEWGGGATEQQSVLLMRGYLQMGHAGMLPLALHVMLVAPIVEELLFRAMVFPAIARTWGTTAGVVISGLVFGVAHPNLAAFVPLSVFGMVLAVIYHRTRNLFACMALHGVFNLAQFLGLVWTAKGGG